MKALYGLLVLSLSATADAQQPLILQPPVGGMQFFHDPNTNTPGVIMPFAGQQLMIPMPQGQMPFIVVPEYQQQPQQPGCRPDDMSTWSPQQQWDWATQSNAKTRGGECGFSGIWCR